MRTQWTLLLALLFALLVAIFAVLNVDSVPVNFIFADASIPLILVILSSALLGGLSVGMFGIIRQYKLQRQIRKLSEELKEFQDSPSFGSMREEKQAEGLEDEEEETTEAETTPHATLKKEE